MFKQILIVGALLAFSTTASAEDFDPAQHLQEHCTRCHTDSMYTRTNRRAKSLPQLKRIVRRCETNLGTGLFDDEIKLMANHLNDAYYKFK